MRKAKNKHTKPQQTQSARERAGADAAASEEIRQSDVSAADSSELGTGGRREPKPIPTGASISWDIPGDVPDGARKRRSSQAPVEHPAPGTAPPVSAPDPDPDPVKVTVQEPLQSPPDRPNATDGKPERSYLLLALLALLLVAGLGGVGYGYFAHSTGKTVNNATAGTVGQSGLVSGAPNGADAETGGGAQRHTGQAGMGEVTAAAADSDAVAENDGPKPAPVSEQAAGGSEQQSASAPQVITYVVKKGDTLWDIAKKYLHDPFRYPELAKLSHIREPHWIYPGDVVRIPLPAKDS